ncbi:MAG: xanthine dehydrogenase [Porticoccaceae bacterium]|nr:MAG: xanthine dehydrogenase [Porticoccaceae bacterium]
MKREPLQAAAVVAERPQAPVAPARTARYVGRRVPRKEDPRLLTGHGRYVDDVVVPGMFHVAFARSPVARGRIRRLETRPAREVEGVQAVFTQADLDRFPTTLVSFFFQPPDVPITPLARDRVVYAGEPVALVVATSRAVAEDAASLVEIEIDEEPPVVTLEDARHGPPVHPEKPDNINAELGDEEPDPELAAILDSAPLRLRHRVVHQRICQSPMETRGIVACPEGRDELTLYVTCQSPHLVARWVATALHLPETAVRVIAKDVGGGFGLKNHPWKEEVAVILAARLLGRPLKWIEDRYENLTTANQAREQEMTLDLAFDAEGRLLGAFGDYHLNVGAHPQLSECNVAVHMFLWPAYHLPRYGFISRGWYTNTVGYAAYRGPWAMESLIRETALDRAARRLGLDPVEIRRRNLVRRSELPVTTCLGMPVDDISPAECLERLLEYLDVAAFRREQEEARRAGRYLGLGIATYVEPTGAAGEMPVMTGELAQLRVDPTGQVVATLSTHSQGHGTATTMAQLIAEHLGARYEEVVVFEGDSSRGGFSPGAAGSRQAVVAGGAVILAAERLADRIRRIAAHLLGGEPNQVVLEEGRARLGERSLSFAEIAQVAYGEPKRLPPGMEPGLEVQHRYQPPPVTFSSAANACVVEVDTATGFVRILRWIVAEDCGVEINPAVVEGQVAGGLAQSIGMALLEEVVFDERGNVTTPTYKDYLLPTIFDVPEIEFLHVGIPSKAVGGMRGVGEGGAIIGTPTLVNAIADALAPFGELPVELPLTPPKLLAFIEGRSYAPRRRVAGDAASPGAAGEPAPVPARAEGGRRPGGGAARRGGRRLGHGDRHPHGGPADDRPLRDGRGTAFGLARKSRGAGRVRRRRRGKPVALRPGRGKARQDDPEVRPPGGGRRDLGQGQTGPARPGAGDRAAPVRATPDSAPARASARSAP